MELNIKRFYELSIKTISEKKNKPFFKGGLGSFFIKFGNRALTFILGVVLARTLGAEAFGIYTFVYAVIQIIGIPTELGLPNLLVRFIAKYEVENKWGEINGILKFSNIIVAVVSTTLMLISFCILYFEFVEFETAKYNTFLWGITLLPVIALGAVRAAALRGFRLIVHGLIPDGIIKPSLFIAFLLLIYWQIGGTISASTGMVLNFIASTIAYFIGAYWLIKYMPSKVKKEKPTYDIKKWSIVAMPLLLTGGVKIILGRIDVVFLGILSSSEAVGIYEVGYKGAGLVSLSINAFIPFLAPYYSRYFSKNNHKKIQKIATISVLVNSAIALFIALILIVFGDIILEFIFGEEFVKGYIVMIIIAISHLINTLFGTLVILMNMTGYERKVLIGISCATFANIILNIILIPIYDIEGAAIASLLSTLLWNYVLYRTCKKSIGIDTTIISVYRYLYNSQSKY
jgi:O-antigen/teichoic acid export membrane protein